MCDIGNCEFDSLLLPLDRGVYWFTYDLAANTESAYFLNSIRFRMILGNYLLVIPPFSVNRISFYLSAIDESRVYPIVF